MLRIAVIALALLVPGWALARGGGGGRCSGHGKGGEEKGKLSVEGPTAESIHAASPTAETIHAVGPSDRTPVQRETTSVHEPESGGSESGHGGPATSEGHGAATAEAAH